jgi:glutamate dehydrogenase (NAD(P)+)
MLEQIEKLSGQSVSKEIREMLISGPDEIDLVRSGLEETMISATHEIVEMWKQHPEIRDMRTASFVVAINKVGTSYTELGIFP